MYLSYQNNKIVGYTEEAQDLVLYNLDKVEYTEDEYILDGDEYVLKDEAWEEKQAQKERERIAKLSCTKRDFALMLQEMGVDYFTTLKPLIESNPQAQLEWELCERLYRFNPMLDLMAGQLGVTSEQLDGLFKYANGEITLEEFRALKSVKEEDPQGNQDTSEVEPVDDPSLTQEEIFNLEE